MKRRDLISHIQAHGCVLLREGASHSIWTNPQLGRKEAIPRHTEIKKYLRDPFAATWVFLFRREINTNIINWTPHSMARRRAAGGEAITARSGVFGRRLLSFTVVSRAFNEGEIPTPAGGPMR